MAIQKILITGARGNIGSEVIKQLLPISGGELVAGVRDIEKAKAQFQAYPQLQLTIFDFENAQTFGDALSAVDVLFLLRPPHLADVDKYFKPLLIAAKEAQVRTVVFLSVQGVELSKWIPHNKIERLIKSLGLNHVFLRPSYFMQNLTTTLLTDIRQKRKIILPAGKAKFNWVDVRNIGEVAALVIQKISQFQNQAIEITGLENEDFYHVAELISDSINEPVIFQNVNPLHFYLAKRKEGMSTPMILVMIMLHFLPRFQSSPRISSAYQELIGHKPTSLKAFIERSKNEF